MIKHCQCQYKHQCEVRVCRRTFSHPSNSCVTIYLLTFYYHLRCGQTYSPEEYRCYIQYSCFSSKLQRLLFQQSQNFHIKGKRKMRGPLFREHKKYQRMRYITCSSAPGEIKEDHRSYLGQCSADVRHAEFPAFLRANHNTVAQRCKQSQ